MDEKQQTSGFSAVAQLHDPIDAILEQRGKVYGEFADHAFITQQLKNVMHDTNAWRNGISLPKGGLGPIHKEALDMIVHKIGRILNGDPNYADSWDDIAGYARLVADRVRK